MSRVLHVFDVSPFVHAGHVNKYSKLEQIIDVGVTWKTQVTPTGGASLIFNSLYSIVGKGDCVFCCDRNPTIKKSILPTYKCRREHARDIEIEKAVAEYLLELCGFTVIARAGYEADDIAYSIVKKFYNQYDNIYVYTSDSDYYFMVDDKVSIMPSSSRAKQVTKNTYEQVLYKKHIRYNLQTLLKIADGDTSDDIPALPEPLRSDVKRVFSNEGVRQRCGDPEYVREMMKVIFPDAVKQVDLVFPLIVEDLPNEIKQPDISMVRNVGDAINNKMFRGMAAPGFSMDVYIEDMQSKGYYVEEV